MLLILALLPLDVVQGGNNILSLLAQMVRTPAISDDYYAWC